jgi:hypothetical protein
MSTICYRSSRFLPGAPDQMCVSPDHSQVVQVVLELLAENQEPPRVA